MGGKIRVAVVGGNFGEIHIQGYRRCPEMEVVAICRRDQKLAKQLSQRYQIQKFFTDFDELIQSEDIDVVSLAVPNHLHCPMTLKALDHGKHVVCEKPLALDLNQAMKMANRAEEKGLIHMIVFNLRFVPAIIRMKELIEKGEIGSIHHILFTWESSSRRERDSRFFWRHVRAESGFGALGDVGVHGIDLIQWIFGDFKKVVSHMSVHVPEHRTDEGEYKKTEVEDSCSFLGELTNGPQVVFHVSSITSCGSSIRLEVYGEKGVLGAYLFPRSQNCLGKLLGGKGEKSFQESIPIPKRLKQGIMPIGERVTLRVLSFGLLARQLMTAIQRCQIPSPNFFDGIKAQKVLSGLQTSWEKEKWVNVV